MVDSKKRIVLAGANGGLGKAICQALRDDYAIIGVGRKSPSKGEFCAEVDLSSHSETKAFAKNVLSDGPVYAVINSIGVVHNAPLWSLEPGLWSETIATHLGSCFNLISAFGPQMREARIGRFIFFSSVVAKIGSFGASHYAAAKGGIEALVRSAAIEFASRGVTVNAIAPGYMDSGVIRHVPDTLMPEILKRIPSGKLGPSFEVASLTKYLLSKDSSYMTGQTLSLDGGMH